MAERGYAWAVTGLKAADRVLLSPEQQAEVGYDKTADTEWDQVVQQQPGATWGERLRNAIQLTLEDYDYDKDAAVRDLRDNGDKGIVRFASDGTPIGGKALAGALRAAARHPRMQRLYTREEVGELEAERERQYKAGVNPRAKRRPLTESERAYRTEQATRRAAAREVLERSGGGTDLRRRPTASKHREERQRQAGQARREGFRRAAREAAAARQAAQRAAQPA